jgi:hypothetical protein
MSNIGARGGALRVQQAEITTADLIAYRDRLGALQVYIGELIRDSVNLREGEPLSDLPKPTITGPINVTKESWWTLRDISRA